MVRLKLELAFMHIIIILLLLEHHNIYCLIIIVYNLQAMTHQTVHVIEACCCMRDLE